MVPLEYPSCMFINIIVCVHYRERCGDEEVGGPAYGRGVWISPNNIMMQLSISPSCPNSAIMFSCFVVYISMLCSLRPLSHEQIMSLSISSRHFICATFWIHKAKCLRGIHRPKSSKRSPKLRNVREKPKMWKRLTLVPRSIGIIYSNRNPQCQEESMVQKCLRDVEWKMLERTP